MSDKGTTVGLLRGLIAEMVTIAVEHPKGADGKQKPLKVFELDDDQGDEVEWLLRRFGAPKLKYTRVPIAGAGENEPKTRKELQSGVKEDVLAKVIKGLVPPAEEELLFNVIEPWGQMGVDILLLIQLTQSRTGKAFPFFSHTESARVGETVAFPTAPSAEVVSKIVDTTPRIGSNDTGKGELLLALLTGGIAGGSVGDLTIGSNAWELKAGGGEARLGDTSSKTFEKKAREWWNESGSKRDDIKASTPDGFIDMLASTDAVRDLPLDVKGVLNDFARVAANVDSGLAGFVVVDTSKKRFLFRPIDDVEFHTHSASRRTHVDFTVLKTEKEAAAAERAAKKAKQEEEDRLKKELRDKQAAERAEQKAAEAAAKAQRLADREAARKMKQDLALAKAAAKKKLAAG